MNQPLQSLTGKAILVGASGGIGSAVALAMARNGIDTALIGRNRPALVTIAESCSATGSNAFPVVCDIAKTATIEAAVDEAIRGLGGLNFLIHCAGVSIPGRLDETDLETSDAILDTNLRSLLYLARFALPEINRYPGGAVVKIGAVNSPRSGVNTYLASNQGAFGLAEALFEDVREFGTRVCTIRPGWVNTPLVQSDNIDSALMIQPEDIAQTILFVLSMAATACPVDITILPQRSPYIR